MEELIDAPVNLGRALREMVSNPLRTLVPPWSWKAAAFTAVIRGLTFFATNLQSGRQEAQKALVVEALFAFATGGLIGAISQQLRRAEPLWATALIVWVGLPSIMLLTQSGVHRLAHTPHLSGGLVLSYCVAVVAAAFSWYAMRHGAMLGGTDETTVLYDLEVLPQILLRFLLVGPTFVVSLFRVERQD
jgi:hypothetical protein